MKVENLVIIKKLKYLKIELIKLIIALLSLATIMMLSHQNKDAMISFVMIQAIITVMSSCLDFGSNVLNMNVAYGNLRFCESNVDKKLYFGLNTVVAFIIFFFYQDTIEYYLLPFLIIGSVGNVFLMRSSTVYRRSGLAFESIIKFELSLVLLKFLSYPILIILGVQCFKIFLMLCPIFIASVAFKKNKVENLSLFKTFLFSNELHEIQEKIEIKYLIISASIAFKNQALSLFIPLASQANQGLVVVITRVNSIVSLACSGINARIPSIVKEFIDNKKINKLAICYLVLILAVTISCMTLPYYIPFISSFFKYSYNVDYFSYEYLLGCVIFFSVLQAANQIVFQSLGKSKLSLASEYIYIFILFIIMNKV